MLKIVIEYVVPDEYLMHLHQLSEDGSTGDIIDFAQNCCREDSARIKWPREGE